jgi:hypothetical protein
MITIKDYANRRRVNTLNYSSFIARGTSVTSRTRKLLVCWRDRYREVVGKAKVLVKVQLEGKCSEFK